MEFSCCSRYMKCSSKGFCINPLEELRKDCSYKRKLEKGINYFKPKEKDNLKTNIKTQGAFIEIDSRIFYIGRRSSYGSWTYSLNEKEIDWLKEILSNRSINLIDQTNIFNCMDEAVSDQDRACCRVILTIGENQYNIQNYNIRGIKESTAIKLRDDLRSHGLLAAVEYVGSRIKNNQAVPTYDRQSKAVATKEEKKEMKFNAANAMAQPMQISIFDMMKT